MSTYKKCREGHVILKKSLNVAETEWHILVVYGCCVKKEKHYLVSSQQTKSRCDNVVTMLSFGCDNVVITML